MKSFFVAVLFLSLLPLFGYAQNADDQYKEGLAAYNSKDWDSAVSIMNDVIKNDPSNWQAYQILGYAYSKQKDLENSLQSSEASLKLHPDNPTLQKFVDRLKVKLSETSDTGTESEATSTPTTTSTSEEAESEPTTTPSSTPTQAKTHVVKMTPTVTTTPIVKNEEPFTSHGFLDLAVGFDQPALNWQSAYKLSPGGEFGIGYDFGFFDMQIDVDGFYFSGVNYSSNITDFDLKVLPSFRFNFANTGFRPYLLVGAGADFQYLTATTGSLFVSDFDFDFGAGFSIQLSGPSEFFLEGKYNLVYTIFPNGQLSVTPAGEDLPVLAGFRFGI